MWVIATTYQGGGTIDDIAGPYRTEAEAEKLAAALREWSAPRHDLFEVYLLTGDFS